MYTFRANLYSKKTVDPIHVKSPQFTCIILVVLIGAFGTHFAQYLSASPCACLPLVLEFYAC